MIVKCGKREFEVDSTDRIVYNGACYMIVTKKYQKGWYELSPIIADSRFKKLLKANKVEKLDEPYVNLEGRVCDWCTLYKFVDD